MSAREGTTVAGVTIEPIKKMGYHGVKTTDVTFDSICVPKENLVGGMADHASILKRIV